MIDRPATTEGGDRGDLPRSLVLAATALAVRLVYLLESRSSNPFFHAPVVDAQSYLELAQAIVAGSWIGGDAAYWQPPAFPYLLAVVLWLTGDGVFVAIRVLHALLGTVSVLLVYHLGRRCLDRRGATLAAAGTALYGPLLYFEGELLSVALEVVLYLTLLAVLLRALERQRPVWWGLAGAVAGAAAITRPTILLFVALAGAAYLLGGGRSGVRERAGQVLIALAGLGAVIAPVTWRNAVVDGEFVLVSANGGVNFHIGNHARMDSMVAIHPGIDWERLVAEPLADGAQSAAERSRWFFRQGLHSIADSPGRWLIDLTRKTWRLVQGPEIKRNQDIYYAREHSRLLSLLLWDRGLAMPHGLVVPLFLWGLIVTWRRPDLSLRLLRWFLAGYGLAVVLFFVTSRYRVPMVPVAMIFAAAAVLDLQRRWRRNHLELLLPATVIAALGIAVNLPAAPSPGQDAQLAHDLGEVYLRSNRWRDSAEASRRAVALSPRYPSAWHNLAVAELSLGRPQVASQAARRALEQHPLRADTRLLLARALLAEGRLDAALEQILAAVEQEPDHGEVRYGAGRILLEAGAADRALPHLQAAARLRPQHPWSAYDLGRALHALGRSVEALEAFEEAARRDPRRPDALSAAGVVALSVEEAERARDYLRRALAIDPDYGPARINLGLLEIGDGRFDAGIDLLEPLTLQHRSQAGSVAPAIWQALARAYAATGQTQKARAAMKAARAR